MPILKVKTKTEFKKKLKQDTVPPECPELVGVLWTPKIGTRITPLLTANWPHWQLLRKGTVARDFLPTFFHCSYPSGPVIHTTNAQVFSHLVSISRRYLHMQKAPQCHCLCRSQMIYVIFQRFFLCFNKVVSQNCWHCLSHDSNFVGP